MKRTIICHFFNEEYLLPYWLNHHKQIFDHGIMIDYHSTDQSVEIIKQICPTWDIITSRNPNFQADKVDYEVLDIEKDIEGYRIALNVTEFMIGDYSILDDKPIRQFLLPSIFFIDTDRSRIIQPKEQIWDVKQIGFSFADSEKNFKERRARSIHNTVVNYPIPGRHFEQYTTDKLVVFYFGWCPFDERTIARKLQIQTQIPLHDRQRQWGFHHITNKETLMWRLENEFVPRSRDISEDINYYVNLHNKNISNLL